MNLLWFLVVQFCFLLTDAFDYKPIFADVLSVSIKETDAEQGKLENIDNYCKFMIIFTTTFKIINIFR